MLVFMVLCGNVGTGKSIFARQRADKGDIVISLDAITCTIGGGNYDNYDESKKELYKNIFYSNIRLALSNGKDIIIDDTNVKRTRRGSILSIPKRTIDFSRCYYVCYNFGSGDKYSLERRMKEPKGIDPYKWIEVHDRLKSQYEKPIITEGFDDIISRV